MNEEEELGGSPLFLGLKREQIKQVLPCLTAHRQAFKKGEFILRHGDTTSKAGIVLSGSAHIIKEDFWGGRTILGQAAQGQMFGEVYACLRNEPLEVSVIAAENTAVLFLEIQKVLSVCSAACEFHTKLVHNLVSVLAGKNLMLTRKIEHISKRTTREKLLSYLSAESIKQGSAAFEIPFNRQQLADYLAVDRSAMSSELGKLREQGVLQFQRNRFLLKEPVDRQRQ